jgi:hypothetical protein
MRTRLPLSVLALVLLAGTAPAQERSFTVTVTAGKHDCRDVPVCVTLELPPTFTNPLVRKLTGEGFTGPWQTTRSGIVAEEKPGPKTISCELHFILPELRAGKSVTLKATVADVPRGVGIAPTEGTVLVWKDTRGKHADLFRATASPGGQARLVPRPVARYMYEALDTSSKEQRNRTYKVFHHLFDPAGKRLVTNGGNTDAEVDAKKMLYPHHRGLMYAFNRITYDGGKKADTWHCTGDAHQSHEKFLVVEGGPVLGRHRLLVFWHGQKAEVFAREERELTFYNVPGGTLVDFVSRLRTTGDPVQLDGDPQHAGFQFRAANAVAEKTAKQTYFLRPDGKGKLGETRNWDPSKRKGPVNLPWDAMSFMLDGQRYTAAYLNHPSNPGEQRYSERDYGRFGCYFPYELTKDSPLVVRYRVWLQDGEMTVPQVQALSTAFTNPPKVAVK